MASVKLANAMKKPSNINEPVDKHQRFKQLRLRLGLNQQQLAKTLGVTQAHISKVEKGDSFVTSHILDKLSSNYDVNTDWLLTGKGQIFHTALKTVHGGGKSSHGKFNQDIAGGQEQDIAEIRAAIDDINTRLENIDGRLGNIESGVKDLSLSNKKA